MTTKRTLEIKDLAAGQSYAVQVKAVDTDGEHISSNYSLTLNFTTDEDTVAPKAPSTLDATVKAASFLATWNTPTLNEDETAVEDFKDYRLTVKSLVSAVEVEYYLTGNRFDFNDQMNEAAFGTIASGIVGVPDFLTGNVEFRIASRDLANNVSVTETINSALNTAPGALTLVDESDGTPLTSQINWNIPTGGDVLCYRVRRRNPGTVSPNWDENFVVNNTDFVDTGLSRGTYTYVVEVYDKFGNVTTSNEVSSLVKGFWEDDLSVPDKPTISNVASGFDEVAQTSDLTFDITGPNTADNGAITNYDYHGHYEVRWSVSATGPFQYQTVEEEDNTAIHSVAIEGLKPNTLYYYGVKSVSKSGRSGVYETGSTTTDVDTIPPAAPANLSASGSLKNITASWDANTEPDLNHYELHASQTSGFTPIAGNKVYTGNGTGFAHAVVDGATWYYKVYALDKSGNKSVVSTQASATSSNPIAVEDVTPPSNVGTVVATASTYYHGGSERAYVDVTWGAATDDVGVATYIVRYRKNGIGSWTEQSSGNESLFYRVTDLEPGVNYQFAVKAQDAAGNLSAAWIEDTAQSTTDKTTTPGVPSVNNPTSDSPGTLTVRWAAVTNVPVRYYVVEVDDSGALFPSPVAFNTASTRLDLSGVTGAEYHVRVKAVSEFGVESAFGVPTNPITVGKVKADNLDRVLATSVSDRLNVNFDTFDPSDWHFVQGPTNYTLLSDPDYAGAAAIRNNSGPFWGVYEANKIPLDPSKTYKMTIKVKELIDGGLFYAGWQAYDENGTEVNRTGNPDYGTAHYTVANAVNLDGTDQTFIGYMKGRDPTTGDTGAKPNADQPGKFAPAARFIAPMFILNLSGAGQTVIDYIKVEAIDLITDRNFEDGSITSLVKFGGDIRPPSRVTSLPALPNSLYADGALVYLTTDNKLYRNENGTWSKAVPTSDLDGVILEAQINDGAVTGAKINSAVAEKLYSRTLGMQINKTSFNGVANGGELYLHGFDAEGEPADVDGFVYIGDTKYTIPKGQVHTGAIGEGWLVYSTDVDFTARGLDSISAGNLDEVYFVMLEDGVWKYDDNSGTPKPFTPADTDYLVGYLKTSGLDLIEKGYLFKTPIAIEEAVVNAGRIVAGSIYTDALQANAITANKLNITMGGGNIVPNSNFADGNTGWSNAFGLGTNAADGTYAYRGSQSLKITKTVATAGTSGVSLAPTLLLQPNTTYTASAWMYNPAGNTGLSPSIRTGGSTLEPKQSSGAATKGKWTRIVHTFTTDGTASPTLTLYLYGPTVQNESVYFDAIQVEEGDVATSYSPKTDEILPGTINAAMIQTDAVVADKIQANAITTDKIKSGNIITDHMTAGTIGADRLVSGSVKTLQLDAGAVTANKLNVIVGGENLVTNSSFENSVNWKAGWTSGSNTLTFTSSTDKAKYGPTSMKIQGTGVGTSSGYIATGYIPVDEEKSYTASMWANVAATSSHSFRIILRFYDSGPVQLSETNFYVDNSAPLKDKWQRVIGTATSPAGTASAKFWIAGTGSAATDQIVYIDGVQLEEGDYATAYSPQTDEILPGTINAAMVQTGTLTANEINTATIAADTAFLDNLNVSGRIVIGTGTGFTSGYSPTDIQDAAFVDTQGYAEKVITKSPTEPLSPENGDLWLETDTSPNFLYRWDSSIPDWVAAGPTGAGDIGGEPARFEGTVAPADLTVLWVDTSATPNILKRHNGSTWVKLTPTTASEVGAEKSIVRSPSQPGDTTVLWVDTSGSEPYVWKVYESGAWRKLTPTEAGEVGAYTTAETQSYVQSRTDNLVTNGFGTMGSNYNFNTFTYEPAERYSGGGSQKYTGAYGVRLTDELIPVSPSSRYSLSYAAKLLSAGTAGSNIRHYGMTVSYDADGLSILPYDVLKNAGSKLTSLAANLNPGDTTITLTDATGWYEGATAHQRNINFYPYTNAQGYTYPAYTYSRLNTNRMSALGAWEQDGIVGNVITLNVNQFPSGWTGPAYVAGTKVANCASGGSYDYIAGANDLTPTDWGIFSGTQGAETVDDMYVLPMEGDIVGTTSGSSSGNYSAPSGFRWGTANIKVGWLLNNNSVVSHATTAVDAVQFGLLVETPVGAQAKANAAQTAAEANSESLIPKQTNAPAGPVLNDLWLDTSSTPNVIKRWNGSVWVKATPTDVSEIANAESVSGAQNKANLVEDQIRTDYGGGPNTTTILGGSIETGTVDANKLIANTSLVTNMFIASGGSLRSTGYSAGVSGFNLDHNSLEIYGNGSGTDVSLILGANGLNMNTATGELWFGASTFAAAPFSVSPTGVMTAQGGVITGGTVTGADITIGTGNSVFKATASGIQLGNAVFTSAPFRVTPAGALTATGATISGAITATSGTISGTLNVNGGNIILVSGDLRVTGGDVESADGWVLGAGVGFRLKGSDGKLYAQGADVQALNVSGTSTFGGTITASGTIASSTQNASAGWTITNTGTATFKSVDIDGGTLNIGSNFTVTSTGVLTAAGASFTGDVNSGSTITGSAISGGTITIGAGQSVFKADTNGIYLGDTIFANAEFSVTPAGALKATNATITGAITATSGSLSTMSIAGKLTATGSGGRVEVDTAGVRLYNAPTGGTVTVDLNTTSGNGTFTGDVTATGGKFTGDVQIDGGTLSSGPVNTYRLEFDDAGIAFINSSNVAYGRIESSQWLGNDVLSLTADLNFTGFITSDSTPADSVNFLNSHFELGPVYNDLSETTVGVMWETQVFLNPGSAVAQSGISVLHDTTEGFGFGTVAYHGNGWALPFTFKSDVFIDSTLNLGSTLSVGSSKIVFGTSTANDWIDFNDTTNNYRFVVDGLVPVTVGIGGMILSGGNIDMGDGDINNIGTMEWSNGDTLTFNDTTNIWKFYADNSDNAAIVEAASFRTSGLADNPAWEIHSTSAGGNYTNQTAHLAIGESANDTFTVGSPAMMHIAYAGDGVGYVGMGGSKSASDYRPFWDHLSFSYNSINMFIHRVKGGANNSGRLPNLGASGWDTLRVRDSDGLVGYDGSSARWKNDITEWNRSEYLKALDFIPSKFNWDDDNMACTVEPDPKGDREVHQHDESCVREDFGLIAEQVAEIDPRMVMWDEDGNPRGVRYEMLTVYLLGIVRELAAEAKLDGYQKKGHDGKQYKERYQ